MSWSQLAVKCRPKGLKGEEAASVRGLIGGNPQRAALRMERRASPACRGSRASKNLGSLREHHTRGIHHARRT
jgi:hypothetical protein|eukprot:SAG25_NODE_165_length_13094_cov_31.386149_8_plen_73_part_00